jgi:hypothetical protein
LIVTLASVLCRPLLVNTSETVVVVGDVGAVASVNCSWPGVGAALPATVTVGETGQPGGTSTDHDKVVWNERSVSRLKEEGDAVKWPVMSAMQSGGGGGPPPSAGSAREGLVQSSVVAMATGAVRQPRDKGAWRAGRRIVLDRFGG